MDNHLKSWASGFLDGEGSFVIEIKRYKDGRKKDTYLRPKLVVQLREDDEISIHVLQKAIGDKGYFYKRKSRKISTFGSASKPTVECSWHSQNALFAVVKMIDSHPMMGKKASDYSIWREAALLTLNKKMDRLEKHELLLKLREKLIKNRKYKKP